MAAKNTKTQAVEIKKHLKSCGLPVKSVVAGKTQVHVTFKYTRTINGCACDGMVYSKLSTIQLTLGGFCNGTCTAKHLDEYLAIRITTGANA
jgi:hypothetical protein